MATRPSLRRRVAYGFTILGLLVVAAHSVALYFIIDDREEEQINRLVNDEMLALMARYRNDPETAVPRSQNLSAYVTRNALEQSRLPDPLKTLTIGTHEVYVHGEERHVSVRIQDGVRFTLVYDVTHHELQMRELQWLLAFGLFATVVLAGVLGISLARHLIQPVSDLAERVSALGPDGSAACLAPRYQDQEVNRLAEAFDAYAARVGEFIGREQAFTADVSHELRTPLTAIRTGCELLLADPGLSAEVHQRIDRINQSAERMSTVIQSLLLLARQQTSVVPQAVVLHHAAESAIDPMRERMMAGGIAWRNEIPTDVSCTLDPAAFGVVLSNLLRNAVDNTEQGYVAIRLCDAALEIEDTGRGIASSDMSRIFDRHFRGAGARAGEGFGIGLDLVRRIADRYGWHLTLESREGQGTLARLTLPLA